MKRLTALLVLIVIVALGLTSCTTANAADGEGDQGGSDGESFTLTGIVKAVSDRVEIEVVGSDYAFGIYWVLISPDTQLVGADGNAISITDLKEGDTVEVVYGGQVMMSYPPQIVAKKITEK